MKRYLIQVRQTNSNHSYRIYTRRFNTISEVAWYVAHKPEHCQLMRCNVRSRKEMKILFSKLSAMEKIKLQDSK